MTMTLADRNSLVPPLHLAHLQKQFEAAGYNAVGDVVDPESLPEYDYHEFINPKRLPAWRYTRALELHELGARLSPKVDGPLTRELVGYLNIRNQRLRSGVAAHKISSGFRGHRNAIHRACSMFRLDDDHQRYMLESRILAQQTPRAIREVHGTPHNVLHMYERLFFNVVDRMDRMDYIGNEVIGPMFQSGLDTHSPERLSKYFAYFTGEKGLDAINYVFTSRRYSQTDDDFMGLLDAYIQKSIRLQTMYTAVAMVPGRFDIRSCLEAYTQLLSLDMRATAVSEQASWIDEFVKLASTSVPTPRGTEADHVLKTERGTHSVGHIELRAVEQNAGSVRGLPYYEHFSSFTPPEPNSDSGN